MKETTDLWFMAYLTSKGNKIVKFEVLNNNKLKCFFKMEQDAWLGLRTDFANSDELKFKMHIEQLKELMR